MDYYNLSVPDKIINMPKYVNELQFCDGQIDEKLQPEEINDNGN